MTTTRRIVRTSATTNTHTHTQRDGDAHSGRVHATIFSSRSPAAVIRSATGAVLSATASVVASNVASVLSAGGAEGIGQVCLNSGQHCKMCL
jgi:hypothetical protein